MNNSDKKKQHILANIFISVCLVLLITNASAQKQNVFFLKNNGQNVSTRDSADFIRIISEPDPGDTLFTVKEYYRDGKVKLTGKSSAPDHIYLEGTCISFYTSGKREQIASYKNNQMVGDNYKYYPNGKLYCVKEYYTGIRLPGDYMYGNVIFKACNDSLGKNLTLNGDGHFIVYNKDFTIIIENGQVKSGRKIGQWKGKTLDTNQISYTETYEKGVLAWGESLDKNGKTYHYITRDRPPYPLSKDDPFFKAISSPIHRPSLNHEKILINFAVTKDGFLTDLAVVGKLDEDLKNEILNAFEKSSKKWDPGAIYGVPINEFLSIPLRF